MSERASSSATVVLSPSRNPNPLEVPKGLKTLLDDITKEVLCQTPERDQLYDVCAEFLEKKLIQRDSETPIRQRSRLLNATYTTDSDSGLECGTTPLRRRHETEGIQGGGNDRSSQNNVEKNKGVGGGEIKQRVVIPTSDFEEEEEEVNEKRGAKSESILEVKATYLNSVIKETDLLINEKGCLSPLNKRKRGPTPAEELKEIRLETLQRTRLPISIHLGEIPLPSEEEEGESPFLPIKLHIQPEESQNIKDFKDVSSQTSASPNIPVQDDVVARVLLEHAYVEEVRKDPRRTVNYLDLSKLGEEGETPASDEIWLPIGDEDKFLSSDTDTYSITTDKLSRCATMSGGGEDQPLLTESPRLRSFEELDDCSRVLAPIQDGLNITNQNVLDLTGKLKDLELTLNVLLETVDQMKNDKAEDLKVLMTTIKDQCSRCDKKSSVEVDSSATLSAQNETKQIAYNHAEIADQLREDNSILRLDLQKYREREQKLLERMESLEGRLHDIGPSEKGQSPIERPDSLPLIVQDGNNNGSFIKKSKSSVTVTATPVEEAMILPLDIYKTGRRTSTGSRSNSAGNGRITAKLKPINDVTLARSDNSILRQDLQVYRERENQILMRTMDLEEKIIRASTTEDESRKNIEKTKPEVNINIDFPDKSKSSPTGDTVIVEIQDQKVLTTKTFDENVVDSKSEAIEKGTKTKKGAEKKKSSKQSVGDEAQKFEVKKEQPSSPSETDSSASRTKPVEAQKELKKSKTSETIKEEMKNGPGETEKQPQKLKPSEAEKSKSKAKEPEKSKSKTNESEKSKSKANESEKPKNEKSKANKTSEAEKSKSNAIGTDKERSKSKPAESNKLQSKTKNKTLEPVSKLSNAQKSKSVEPTSMSKEGVLKKEDSKKTGASETSTEVSVKKEADNKVIKKSLYEGDDWKVTISSKHQLETVSQTPQTITISPRPKTPPPTPPPVIMKKERTLAKPKEKVEKKPIKIQKEKPISKADPIPTPPMFPTARPPRGHIPIPPHRTVPKNTFNYLSVSPPPPSHYGEHSLPLNTAIDIGNKLAEIPDSAPAYYRAEHRDSTPIMGERPSPYIRSSPDGANSSAIELKTCGRNTECSSSALLDCKNVDYSGEDSLERDLIMEFVNQELNRKDSKVSKERKKGKKSLKELETCTKNSRLRYANRSKSTSQLNTFSSKPKAITIRSHHSVERLPTLTAFDEERVIWLRNLEDDITNDQERRKMKFFKETKISSSSDSSEGEKFQLRKDDPSKDIDKCTAIDKTDSNSEVEDKEGRFSPESRKVLKRKHKKEKKSKALVAECFIISRGWQMDQSRLIRALDRIKCATFSRVQTASTINRMVENLRPHQDVVVLHIGSHELLEASYGAIGDDFSSIAISVSSVISRHIANAASQNRNTHFIISLPLPGCFKFESHNMALRFQELRKTFNAALSTSLLNYINVQCVNNDNLASLDVGDTEDRYYSDNAQLNSKGMRKLAKNWEEILVRITKTKEGNIFVRRASDSSSGGSGKAPWKP